MDETLVRILVIAAVVVIAALAVWAWSGGLRSRRLRQRFGPEYERTLEHEDGDRRRAEAVLRDRISRREELELRPLSPAARQTYLRRWEQTQAEFVDEPRAAVQHAHALLDDVMGARGYPNGDAFEERLDLISVDHPDAIQHYRYAYRLHQETREAGDTAAFTEQRRQALVRYRALFADLLGVPDSRRAAEPDADRRPRLDSDGDERDTATDSEADTGDEAKAKAESADEKTPIRVRSIP